MSYIILCLILIVISYIDIKKKIIPDILIILGIIIGFYFHFTLNALLGMVAGFMLLHTEDELKRHFKKGSVGGGDKKLAAMIGVFLGWQNIIVIYILSFLFKIARLYFKRAPEIALAPYISIATFMVIIYGT